MVVIRLTIQPSTNDIPEKNAGVRKLALDVTVSKYAYCIHLQGTQYGGNRFSKTLATLYQTARCHTMLNSIQYFNYPSINTTNIIKYDNIYLLTGRHVSAIFLAIFRPNKEPEFRYTKCAHYKIIILWTLVPCWAWRWLKIAETCRPTNN